MSDLNRKIMNDLKDKIYEAIADAEAHADEHELSFRFDGPTYGMGGTYDGEERQWYASSQND